MQRVTYKLDKRVFTLIVVCIIILIAAYFETKSGNSKRHTTSFGAYKAMKQEYVGAEYNDLHKWWEEFVIEDFRNNPESLHLLDWKELEECSGLLLKHKGFNVIHTKFTNDKGVDLRVEWAGPLSNNLSAIVECKQRKKGVKISQNIVEYYATAVLERECANLCIMIAPSGFTQGAFEYASRRGNQLLLLDIDGIKEKLLS